MTLATGPSRLARPRASDLTLPYVKTLSIWGEKKEKRLSDYGGVGVKGGEGARGKICQNNRLKKKRRKKFGAARGEDGKSGGFAFACMLRAVLSPPPLFLPLFFLGGRAEERFDEAR